MPRKPGRHHLGHRHRHTVGGQNQQNGINIIGRTVISVSFIPDIIGQGNSIKHADKPDNDSGCGENTPLYDKIRAFALFRPLSRCSFHEFPPY